jgi:tetratricopeptide (TPR) repeat protein
MTPTTDLSTPTDEKKICFSCGVAVLPDEKNCHHCGSDLSLQLIDERPKSITQSKTKPSSVSLTSVKREQYALLAIAFGMITLFGVLGWQGLTSGKKGFNLSGAAGEGAQPESASPPPPSQNPSVNSRAPILLPPVVASRFDSLQKVLAAEKNPSRKMELAVVISDAYLEAGDLARAGEFSKTALELSGNTDTKRILRTANLYDDAKDYEQASQFYAKYLETDTKNADARVDYAITLLNLGKQREGVTEMRKAVDDNPKHQKANLNLGILYAQISRWKDAKQLWETTISINASNDAGLRAKELLEKYKNQN